MRILFLSSSYPRFEGDGTAPFIKSIAETFAQLGHAVQVVAPYDKLVASTDPKGVNVIRFKYAPLAQWHIMGHGRALESDVKLNPFSYLLAPAYFLAATFVTLKTALIHKSEYIYAHWVIPNGIPAALISLILNIPLLISLHGSDIYVARKYRLFRMLARFAFHRAYGVTACSPDLLNAALEMGAPPENTHLVPWGVDPTLFTPEQNSRIRRKSLGLNDDHFIIGCLGRMVYKKGFNILIEAFKEIAEEFPRARLVLGGEGPIREELLALARNLGVNSKLVLPGRITWNDVPEFLACLDLFVLPSIQDSSGNADGLPTVLLEAMGAGTPVVASDVGGVSIVIRDGYNGILVPQGNSIKLAEAIMKLIKKPGLRKTLAHHARKDVELTYNWRNIVNRIISIMS